MIKTETLKQLYGKIVILTETIRNGGGQVFRKGRQMVVKDKWHGWQLEPLHGGGKITRVGRHCFSLPIKPNGANNVI